MELTWSWAVGGLLCAVTRLLREHSKFEEKTLCLTCVNAVVTRGTRGQKRVACNLSGTLRPMKFAVCECTAFCVPGELPKLVIIEGFAPRSREVYAEVAIS